jgi:hypothetical protein
MPNPSVPTRDESVESCDEMLSKAQQAPKVPEYIRNSACESVVLARLAMFTPP